VKLLKILVIFVSVLSFFLVSCGDGKDKSKNDSLEFVFSFPDNNKCATYSDGLKYVVMLYQDNLLLSETEFDCNDAEYLLDAKSGNFVANILLVKDFGNKNYEIMVPQSLLFLKKPDLRFR